MLSSRRGVAHRSIVGAVVFAVAFGCNQQSEKPPPPTCARCCGADSIADGRSRRAAGRWRRGRRLRRRRRAAVRLEATSSCSTTFAALEASTWPEPADLLVEGRSGDVPGRWNGIDPFSIDGVKRGADHLGPSDSRTGRRAAHASADRHERPERGGRRRRRTLTVVRASELELAFSVLSLPVTPRRSASARGARRLQKPGTCRAGVSVRADAAEAVIYVDNGGFTDTATATDDSGIFLLANVPAVAWPGIGVTVTLSGRGVRAAGISRLVSGGVTFAASATERGSRSRGGPLPRPGGSGSALGRDDAHRRQGDRRRRFEMAWAVGSRSFGRATAGHPGSPS